jgi:PIN domain nuclease of toxin-antitoxin system
MSYLLDTHTFIWWIEDNLNLSYQSKQIISNPNNLIFVSAVNTWEITIKKSLGKLNVPGNLEEIILQCGFDVLPIAIKHTLFIENLDKHHDDPFDRLLISQAIIENLTIITRDEKIIKYKVPYILA